MPLMNATRETPSADRIRREGELGDLEIEVLTPTRVVIEIVTHTGGEHAVKTPTGRPGRHRRAKAQLDPVPVNGRMT